MPGKLDFSMLTHNCFSALSVPLFYVQKNRWTNVYKAVFPNEDLDEPFSFVFIDNFCDFIRKLLGGKAADLRKRSYAAPVAGRIRLLADHDFLQIEPTSATREARGVGILGQRHGLTAKGAGFQSMKFRMSRTTKEMDSPVQMRSS